MGTLFKAKTMLDLALRGSRTTGFSIELSLFSVHLASDMVTGLSGLAVIAHVSVRTMGGGWFVSQTSSGWSIGYYQP